jgi:hypothetical protein
MTGFVVLGILRLPLTIQKLKVDRSRGRDTDSDFVDRFMYKQTRMYRTIDLPNVEYNCP